MTDYSKLSDLEINALVSKAIHGELSRGHLLALAFGEFDYCNTPANAWPIIHDNLISISFDSDGYDTPQSSWCKATSQSGHECYGDEKKPLRTAMIAFLMMQESSNANPS